MALEDIAMGKLHGLCIGLDICSTLHMPVSLEDLDWAVEQIMPANPGYLMALPTKNDPMLSCLTTAFQEHVRFRQHDTQCRAQLRGGRVRAGYAIGEVLFATADAASPKAIVHVIDERPGTGHHNYSVDLPS